MDMGDGLYGAAVGAALFVTLAAQVLGVFIISFAFVAGQRLRCYLAIVALVILAGSHFLITAEPGMWGKVFLGRELPGDRAWLAKGYDHSRGVPWLFLCVSVIGHGYIVGLSLNFISGCDSVKAAFHRMITDEL
jgi:hypothetical protein